MILMVVVSFYNSLMINDVENLPIFVSYLYTFLEEMPIQVFCPFFKLSTLLLNCRSYLYILDIKLLLGLCLANVFPCNWVAFSLLTVPSDVLKFLILIWFNLPIFSFVDYTMDLIH